MAANPMQRKSRLAFILGMLVAILIAGVIIMLLLTQIKKVKKEKQDIIDAQPKLATVYTVLERVEKGEELGEMNSIQIDMTKIPENAVTSDMFVDEEGNDVNFKALIDIEPNTIITDSMIEKNSEKSESMRIVEYNMISLPSKLDINQYIDIRIVMPDGTDFVVLSKKNVIDANSSTIWLKLAEKDMVTLNTAIIESYIIEGSKLYATVYSDNTQQELTTTYVPSDNVNALIQANSVDVAKNDNVRGFIENYVNIKSADERISNVQAGFSTEQQKMKSAREAFLGEIGY